VHPQEGESHWTSSAWKRNGRPVPDENKDNKSRIAPGETFVMGELDGPGIIQHLWMTMYSDSYDWAREGWAPDGTAEPNEVLLRITWDGRPRPDVEAPLGDFFASGFGRRMEVKSIPVVVEDGDAYNCYWPMPFRKSAKIELVNQSTKPVVLLYYSVDWIKKQRLPKDTLYFCVRYRQEYPVVGKQEYLILDTTGSGHYVGTVLSVRSRSPDWFGEGDMRVYLDGEQDASLWGTGTEDYFCSAWGWKECSTPYFGVPYLSQRARDPGQMTCAYRWHLLDPVAFHTGIRVAIETMAWQTADENPEHKPRKYGTREDDYSSVAFWYQKGPSSNFAPTTTAEERKLPSLDRVVVWAGALPRVAKHGAGKTRLLHRPADREAGGLWVFTPAATSEAWIEVPFTVARKEPLRLVVELGRSPHGGTYQVSLNGVPLRRPLDTWRSEESSYEYHLMDFWPDPGQYTVRFQWTGRNEASFGDQLAIRSVRLRERRPRVEAIGLHRNDDWTKEQFLYQRANRNK